MRSLDRKQSPLLFLAGCVLLVVILYWGRPVLMPIALALLLTFLLSPIVDAIQRRGVRRAVAVTVVVLLVSGVLGTIIFGIGQQFTGLAAELPQYKDNIREKIADLKSAGRGSPFDHLQRAVNEIIGEFNNDKAPPGQAGATNQPPEMAEEDQEKPVPVVVESDKSNRTILPSALGPVTEALATFALVAVLVIFMLLRLQELRNRLIRIVGYSRLTTTTKALDEAGARISRYLLMQSFINATYGAAVAVGLFFIGLPYVLLWGFFAFLARFIPYVGPWLGALLPISLSLAVFDGWMSPLLVIGLICALELFSNMIMEPMLYGQSVGVSEVALLVAITFWTWVWGPVGLALATPLTVCIVVLCKYIPELDFVEILMGDEPVLDSAQVYYQRLLAGDSDEAAEVVQQQLKEASLPEVFDAVLVPALACAKRDADRGKLSSEEEDFIFQTTREVVENLEMEKPEPAAGAEKETPSAAAEPPASPARILGCSAGNGAGEAMLVMLQKALSARGHDLRIAPPGTPYSQILQMARREKPDIICVGSISPDAVAPTRHLCRTLRSQCRGLKIVAGRLGSKGEIKETKASLEASGADIVAMTFAELAESILALAAEAPPADRPPPAAEDAQKPRESALALP